uniref:Cytochrome c oxidase subunit 7C, mitochondrial n=1 Tax=Peromyscus maniculatus bairdii TaxID=230844 RepID=A0A8C8U5A8_PERMB
MLSQSIWGQPAPRSAAGTMRRGGPGEELVTFSGKQAVPTSYETLYFGSGFAAPFFIARHQLLKKQGCLIHSFNRYKECLRGVISNSCRLNC